MERSGIERLTVLSGNNHYFCYNGKPIWLSGHSRIWPLTAGMDSVDEPSSDRSSGESGVFTYQDEVDRLAEVGGHLFRITPFWPSAWQNGIAMPWKQVERGRFDLTQWDERYFEALDDFCRLCAGKDIIIQMELWDRPGLSRGPTRWPSHPFNPQHNVNYSSDVLPGTDGRQDIVYGKRLFYRSVQGENEELLKHQQAYIARLLDELAPFPNIIYCIDNEGYGGIRWESYWAHRIREKVPDALTTAMPLDPAHNTWRSYFDDPNFTCFDGGGSGLRTATRGDLANHEDFPPRVPRGRCDMFSLVREIMEKYYLFMECAPAKTCPVYVSNGFGKNVDAIWTMFCCGAAGFRYHRCNWDEQETCYRWVKGLNTFIRDTQVAYWKMAPAHHLLRGYGVCLAGELDFVLYIPASEAEGASPLLLRPPAAGKEVHLRYFDCDGGAWIGDEMLPIVMEADGSPERLILRGKCNAGTAVYGRVVG